MTLKHFFFATLVWLTLPVAAQTSYGVTVPDSVKKKCDAVIVSEIGNTASTDHVKYIKGDAQSGAYANGDKWKSYTVFYSFGFPNVKESHVVFSLDFKSDPKRSEVVRD